ncbi:uncharacterized protein [Apostichopus japonicus]|uniref:uncharacterized protein n=1 Tax=Stichopus japonicus TaxID=307972 RepID=UPI003AB679B0
MARGRKKRLSVFILIVSVSCIIFYLMFSSQEMIRETLPEINERVPNVNGELSKIHLHSKSLLATSEETNSFPFHGYLPNIYLHPGQGRLHTHAIGAFLHNPKSGGTTIKECMKKISKTQHKNKPILLSSDKVIQVVTNLKNGVAEVNDHYMGDMALGICDFVGERPCAYFTVLRDPFERSVSHYYFCKEGGEAIHSCNGSLEEFTLSVCSSFYLQMTCRLLCERGNQGDEENTDWQCKRVRVAGTKQFSNETNQSALQYILGNLDKLFAVVGITEDFKTTLQLFEDTFGKPFYKTCYDFHNNAGRYINGGNNITARRKNKIRESEIKRLRGNEKVRQCLHEDTVIYEKVKEIFEIQKQKFIERRHLVREK